MGGGRSGALAMCGASVAPRRSGAGLLAAAGIMLLIALAPRTPVAAAGDAAAGDLRVRVVEMARSVDLARGREEFLTVAVEISGGDAGSLRRVQPLRDDFRVIAGK